MVLEIHLLSRVYKVNRGRLAAGINTETGLAALDERRAVVITP